MICVSNMNRSMGAHLRLLRFGFRVESYGIGVDVKLPGPTPNETNIFPFGTPYNIIKRSLQHRNQEIYSMNGLIELCDRNKCIKKAPQKWQARSKEIFDVVITFEKYVFNKVVDLMEWSEESKIKA